VVGIFVSLLYNHMSPTILLAAIAILLALIFNFTNCFNDSANRVATVISSRALAPMNAPTVDIPEETIVEAVRLLFGLANLKVEPTAALGVAAVMAQPELFRGESVCCVVSGGNVDPAVYAHILAG
jgi:threonine synthase